MKRLLLLGGLLLLVVAGLAWWQRGAIALRVYEAGAARAVGRDTMRSLPDGLHAGFCGTGSPLPDPDRNGPCLAVVAGGRLFVVDAGEGAAKGLARLGFPAGRVQAVLLTHFHSDHLDGLGALMLQRWVGGAATAPLPLVGPAGVEAIAQGFNVAYATDAGYRTAHHGAAVAPPSGFGVAARAFPVPAPALVVFEEGGLKVTAFAVSHAPAEPAVGYRFDYKGRCITVSGDTAPDDRLVAAAKGCDLLVHEALQPRLTRVIGRAARDAGQAGIAKIMADIEDYHTSPEQAADLAARAGVGALALTHIVPALPFPALEPAFLGDARERFAGELWVAADGEVVSLPAGGGMERRKAGRFP
jgi:ribonuclease Z